MDYSIYYRTFFKCDECGFIVTPLGKQARYEIESCPCCGFDLDYLNVQGIEQYLKELKEELKYM